MNSSSLNAQEEKETLVMRRNVPSFEIEID